LLPISRAYQGNEKNNFHSNGAIIVSAHAFSKKRARRKGARKRQSAQRRRGRNLCTVEHRSSSSLSRVLFSPSIKRHSICKGEEIRAKRTPGRKERRKRGGGGRRIVRFILPGWVAAVKRSHSQITRTGMSKHQR
jgi:hypothetical protein